MPANVIDKIIIKIKKSKLNLKFREKNTARLQKSQ